MSLKSKIYIAVTLSYPCEPYPPSEWTFFTLSRYSIGNSWASAGSLKKTFVLLYYKIMGKRILTGLIRGDFFVLLIKHHSRSKISIQPLFSFKRRRLSSYNKHVYVIEINLKQTSSKLFIKSHNNSDYKSIRIIFGRDFDRFANFLAANLTESDLMGEKLSPKYWKQRPMGHNAHLNAQLWRLYSAKLL